LNDGMINTPCFAVMMLPYLLWRAVFSIVDSIVSCVRKGINSRNPVSETYPVTEKAIIL